LLASLLREARRRSGLTQQQVAAQLNRTASFVHKSENASRALNSIELRQYLRALGVPFLDFMKELDEALNELERKA
jgi:transcriptional regulator with XRE-family HTH domain